MPERVTVRSIVWGRAEPPTHWHFNRAMRCKRGLCCHAVSVRPSVCPSVTFVDHVKLNKHIFEIFSPSGSDTILVFPYQTGCRYSDGNPLTGASNARGYDKMTIFSQISNCRPISETVIVRWAHAARQFVSIESSFHPYNISRDCPSGVPRENKNVVKIAIFGLTH